MVDTPPAPIHVDILRDLIDYAGLFPPAGLELSEVMRNYARYKVTPEAMILGRLIIPLERIPDFCDRLEGISPDQRGTSPWRISVLLPPYSSSEVDSASNNAVTAAKLQQASARCQAQGARIDTVEFPATLIDAAKPGEGLPRIPSEVQPGPRWFMELSPASIPAATTRIVSVAHAPSVANVGVKIRFGGVRAELFPAIKEVARALTALAAARIPFKATAGLHHVIPGVYPLTYASDAPHGPMFGFLNLLLSSALAWEGATAEVLEDAFLDPLADTLIILSDGWRWRGRTLTHEALLATRREFFLSFGSCSFDEPIDELRAHGWLPTDFVELPR